MALNYAIGILSLKHEAAIGADGLPHPQRFWAVFTVGIAIFMTVSDQTIANIALPIIRKDLNIDAASSVWIVNAYQLAVMLPLLPLAAAGDILGYKRVYLVGLTLFTLASLGCALAPDLGALVFMRVVQGLGAAGVMSVNMALVRFIHPIQRLGHGIGINAVVIAVSAAVGPTIASSVLAIATWPWLFAIKLPIGLAAIMLGYYALPESPRASHAFDVTSAVLSAVVFATLIAFIDSFTRATPPFLVAAELTTALVGGYFLCRRQVRMPVPLLPIDLLRIPIFALSVGTSICSFIALPFSLQEIGFSAVETGLLMTPWPLATAVVAPISGRLSDRYPAGLLGLLGLFVFGIALALLALLPHGASVSDVAWRMVLAGAGFGLFQSPNNRTMQSSAPRERSGGASGVQSVARLLGQTIGAAFTAIAFSRFAPEGGVAALWLGAIFSLVGAGVSAARLTDLRG